MNKRNVLLFIIITLFTVGCQTYTGKDVLVDQENWTLVWADEFTGRRIDRTKWTYDLGGHGFGNRELQYYTDETRNSSVRNGLLTITVFKEKYRGNPYTSAKLWTKDLASWEYGKFVIKARLPKGQGIWPAIWMLPEDPYAIKWPACGELDIMELVGHQPQVVHGTLHYGEPWEYHGNQYALSEGDFSDEFHTFSMEWSPEKIEWFVDGNLFFTRTEWFSNDLYNRNEYEYPAPFNKRFMLILNIAVGGEWPGNPDETTVFPQTMDIDYVRVYQPK